MWLARQLELPELLTIQNFPIVWSIIGSALFVAVLGFLNRRRTGLMNFDDQVRYYGP
jgi:hypothetical protein